MSARQLRLFPHAKPLLDRLGVDFFRAVPTRPGVYMMRGEGGLILYIGQSKNLRYRLATYKNAHPEDTPRKIIRMIHQARTIEWEVCASPEEAVARETILIRRHRPKFNVQNTWPVTWFYLGIRRSEEALHLRLTSLAQPRPEEFLHGAFQGRMMGRRCFRSLIRLLWSGLNRPASPFDFPLPFSQRLAEWKVTWSSMVQRDLVESLPPWIERYLRGESAEVLDHLERALLPPSKELENPTPLQTIFLTDVERLREFFLRGPAALLEFRRARGLQHACLPPEELASGAKDEPALFLWDRPRQSLDQTEFVWDAAD